MLLNGFERALAIFRSQVRVYHYILLLCLYFLYLIFGASIAIQAVHVQFKSFPVRHWIR